MDIIILVVSVFDKEQELLGVLSACDMYLLLRATEISPSLEELLSIFETLSQKEIGTLSLMKKAPSAENTIYELKSERGVVDRLRALAFAIERGTKQAILPIAHIRKELLHDLGKGLDNITEAARARRLRRVAE